MKATLNGKRYDTSRCEELGKKAHYNYANNYCGTSRLMRADDGEFLVWTNTNGQDLHLQDDLCLFEESNYSIDDFDLDDEQEKRCAELGLIKIV